MCSSAASGDDSDLVVEVAIQLPRTLAGRTAATGTAKPFHDTSRNPEEARNDARRTLH